MKKLIALALSLCCIFGCLAVTSTAYELTEEDYCANFEMLMTSYLPYAECYEGYFAENTAPSDRFLYNYILNNVPFTFPEYCVDFYEDDESYIEYYQVPAEILESFMGTMLTETPELISALRNLDIYVEGDDPYYNIVYDYFNEDYDFGDVPEIEEISFYGYEPLGNNEFLCYAYTISTGTYDEDFNFIPYEPTPTDIAQANFIYIPVSQIELDPQTFTLYQITKYVPAKILGAIRGKVVLNGETFTVSSFEKITRRMLAYSDISIISESSYSHLLSGLVFGAAIDIRPDTFENKLDTIVKTTVVNGRDNYNYVANILGFENYADNVFSIVNIEAICENKTVHPQKPVEITITALAESDSHLAICKIEDDGSIRIFDTVSTVLTGNEITTYSAYSAMVDDFGTFALVRIPKTKSIVFDTEDKLSNVSTSAPSYTIGDINEDNSINAKDSLELKLYIAGANNRSLNFINCDINCDGKIQAKDLLALNRSLVGLDDGYNVGLTKKAAQIDTSNGTSVKFTNTNDSNHLTIGIDTANLNAAADLYNYCIITYKCDKDLEFFAKTNGANSKEFKLIGDDKYHSIIIDISDTKDVYINNLSLFPMISANESMYIHSISFAATYEAALYEAVYQESRI